jgi:hypothetical protein
VSLSQEHEAHVVNGANPVGALKVASEQLQQTAKSFRPALRERSDYGEFRDPALPGALPAGVLRHCCRCHFSCEIGDPVLQRDSAQLGRATLLQLLDLLLDRPGLIRFDRRRCFGCYVCLLLSSLFDL